MVDEVKQSADTTLACFHGYADCVEGAMEKGGIIGSGVYEPGKVKNTTVMERAYQMGKTYKREFGPLKTKKPSVFGPALETCLSKREVFSLAAVSDYALSVGWGFSTE